MEYIDKGYLVKIRIVNEILQQNRDSILTCCIIWQILEKLEELVVNVEIPDKIEYYIGE